MIVEFQLSVIYSLLQTVKLESNDNFFNIYIDQTDDNFPFSIDSPQQYAHTAGTTYQQLKNQLIFIEDFAGVTNWVMRFPRTIYSADLKNRHIFNENTVDIQKISNPQLEQRWKYFVITRSDGKRYFCTAQVYYEKAPLKCRQSTVFSATKEVFRQFYVPKCLVLMSELPYYKVMVNLLKVFRQLKKPQPIISYSINEGLYKVYSYLTENNRQKEWEHITVRQDKQNKKTIPSTEFTFNYYLQNCNEHKNGQAILIQKATHKQVMHLYKLYANSLYEISYIFHLPFSSNTLRLILSAILQEKQIIFTSNNQNLTTLIIETLMRMILPLKWCYMYVPNMPLHLIESACQSFMPYIVGLSKKYLNLIDTSERVVVFVEEDKFVYQGELTKIHPHLNQYLTYVNNDTKNYLQWEKQIRIKSISLITCILEDCLRQEHFNVPVFTKRRTATAPIISTQQTPPQNSILSPESQYALFIQQFMKNSMMFKNFKEDTARGLCQQSSQLLQVPRDQRHHLLIQKFKFLSSHALYPIRYDNQKKWIKYYDRVNKNRKKFRFNRFSLHSTSHPFVPQSMKQLTTSSSMIVTSSKLDQRFSLAQSNVFH